ncbi:MAG: hypothetical protein WCR51_14075 [Planctomycetia bacterium]
MRSTLLAVAALAFLRIVVGLHFFLEGLSHLRDPEWSSAGFRKAAVGPLADWYRASLPETGAWSETLGARDGRSAAEAADAWKASIVAGWKNLLAERNRVVPLDAPRAAEAEQLLAVAGGELDTYVAGVADELGSYRLEIARLDEMRRSPTSRQVPFARDRVAKKQKELSGQAAGWMKDAAAIGTKLVAGWDEQLSAAERLRADDAAEPSALWKADRFVSWSLVTIGACLVLGLLVKFNAMGGACFLASVIASQPFWVPGAQATYDQWVEVAALLAIAALPVGGWSGLDYFVKSWCPLSRCCDARGGTRS